MDLLKLFLVDDEAIILKEVVHDIRLGEDGVCRHGKGRR